MSARSPEELHQRFTTLFNARDLDGLMGLYEPDAALVPQSGAPTVGYVANRKALEQSLAMNGRIEIKTREVIRTGDIALLRGEWRVTGQGPDGTPLTMSGKNIEVARKQSAGHWQFIIDHPYGGE